MSAPRFAVLSSSSDKDFKEPDCGCGTVLYLVYLNDHVYACKAHSRDNAIQMARDSLELGPLMEYEAMTQGRPVNPNTLSNMRVIRVKPWHRFGDWSSSEPLTELYIYTPENTGKPIVYRGKSQILDFVSTKGFIQRVTVYTSGEKDTHIYNKWMGNVKDTTCPIGMVEPYEIV
jgi:hypothetical protein